MHGAGARVLTCLALRSRPRLCELWVPVHACSVGEGAPLELQSEGCAPHVPFMHAVHALRHAET